MDLVYIAWIPPEFDNYHTKIACITAFESINALALMPKSSCKIIKSGASVQSFRRMSVIMYR